MKLCKSDWDGWGGEALSAGSLHFSSKGYVMVLRRKSRSVQALRRRSELEEKSD